jgi:hypothetical protein
MTWGFNKFLCKRQALQDSSHHLGINALLLYGGLLPAQEESEAKSNVRK